MSGGLLQRFFSQQVALCRKIESSLFANFSHDGNAAFATYVREAVVPGLSVVDVGGGKTPFFPLEDVTRLGLRVTGVDIDALELASAPPGCYRATVVSPIEAARGDRDHDLVLAQSVLEHVRSGREAALGIASFGKPGARVITFCPNRRAWFARLNVLMPEPLKRRILFFVFPAKRDRQGYPAFYDACTPGELVANMATAGVPALEVKYFYTSSYFMFFVPLYLLWRLCTYPLMYFWPARYCETFMFVGRVE